MFQASQALRIGREPGTSECGSAIGGREAGLDPDEPEHLGPRDDAIFVIGEGLGAKGPEGVLGPPAAKDGDRPGGTAEDNNGECDPADADEEEKSGEEKGEAAGRRGERFGLLALVILGVGGERRGGAVGGGER